MNSSTFLSRFRVRPTIGARESAAAGSRPVSSSRTRVALNLLAMEPRMLFDGAGAVAAVNHDPVAMADCRVVAADAAICDGAAIAGNTWGDAADSDADGHSLHVTGIISGDWGGLPKGNVGTAIDGVYGSVAMQADGSYSYTPYTDLCLAPGECVTDVFTYTICDDQGGESSTTLTLTVTGPQANHAPVGVWDLRTVSVGQTVAGQAVTGSPFGDRADTDGDGDALTVIGVSTGYQDGIQHDHVGQTLNGVYGQLTLQADGSYTYTPYADLALERGQTVREVFTYSIADDDCAQASTWLKFDISRPNQDPAARDDVRSISTTQVITDGQAIRGNTLGDVSDTDADGDALTVTGAQAGNSDSVTANGVDRAIQGQFGVLTLQADGRYTYTPNRTDAIAPGQVGQDVFSYLICDQNGGEAVAQIAINVSRAADPAPPPTDKPGPTKLIDPITVVRPIEMLEPAQVGKQPAAIQLAPVLPPIFSRLSEVRDAANEPIRFEIPRDPFAPFSPERVLGEVQEMPAEAPKVAALPTVKADVAQDDCQDQDKPVAKLKPKMVKPSVFAKPLSEAPKRFSEQIQAARKAFKAPAVVAPVRAARDC